MQWLNLVGEEKYAGRVRRVAVVRRDPTKIQCVSATNDLLSGKGREHQVVRLINHHVYHRTNLKHDIALIQVTPKFIFDGREAQTKLPPKSYQVPVGALATVVGWGRTEQRGKPADKLQFVTDVVIDTETCKKRMLDLGDSGGPFFYGEYQIGVVSWFMNKCGAGPSVYTKLSEHIDWINEQIAPYKL
ncbi:hypothetical protein B566_EDAN007447 [Ephemera danica]|nr:hypothetical protein B566_EDAN007447 [Ephemera danica]